MGESGWWAGLLRKGGMTLWEDEAARVEVLGFYSKISGALAFVTC